MQFLIGRRGILDYIRRSYPEQSWHTKSSLPANIFETSSMFFGRLIGSNKKTHNSEQHDEAETRSKIEHLVRRGYSVEEVTDILRATF